MIPLTRLVIVQLSLTLGKGLLEAGIEMHPSMHRSAGQVYFFVFNFFCLCMGRIRCESVFGWFPGDGRFPREICY